MRKNTKKKIIIDEAIVTRAAQDNPDLPIDFVRDLLISLEESRQNPNLLEPFIPETNFKTTKIRKKQ